MAGTWKKLKKSLSKRFSFQSDSPPPPPPPSPPLKSSPSDISVIDARSSVSRSSSFVSRLSRSISSRSSSTKTCAICLGSLRAGRSQAIFTAECSHSFHFNCIASSVRHGNLICPICRSKWKDIPFHAPRNVGNPQCNAAGRTRVTPYHSRPPSLSRFEPDHFSDDEPLPVSSATDSTLSTSDSRPQVVTVKAIPEFPAVSASGSHQSFTVLVGIRAPPLLQGDAHCLGRAPPLLQGDAHCLGRAPIDLVTVLDVSGSMSGSKLSLLKRAVRFVVQNLGPLDRLAIVSFSSTARRIFPLRRMIESGRDDAILAIDALSASGGTNIVEGLRKGVRVLEERRQKNPVASIILLSDGRDTHNSGNNHQHRNSQNQSSSNPRQVEYLNLLPASICPSSSISNDSGVEFRHQPTIPVHSFGFGSDHDATAMNDISNASGGMFSFIESVDILQDAFARCIGGLLSVVAQEVRLTVRSISPGVHIGSIPSGRYLSEISNQGQLGVINVGDLYADEEKEFLVHLSIPQFSEESNKSAEKMPLLDVTCSYKDAMFEEMRLVDGKRVEISRPKVLSPIDTIMSLEVDRQRNRLLVLDSIAEAQRRAESGNLDGAQSLLAQQRSSLLSSVSAQAGDPLCHWLETELREIRERMSTREMYEHSGKAYLLSGLSSHSRQRATTRGDSVSQTFGSNGGRNSSTNIVYDTPTMVSMVNMSQTLAYITTEEELCRRLKKSSSVLNPRRL